MSAELKDASMHTLTRSILTTSCFVMAVLAIGCQNGGSEPECRCTAFGVSGETLDIACGESTCLDGEGYRCIANGIAVPDESTCGIRLLDAGVDDEPDAGSAEVDSGTDAGTCSAELPTETFPAEFAPRCFAGTRVCLASCADYECREACYAADETTPVSVEGGEIGCVNCLYYQQDLCARQAGCVAQVDAYVCCLYARCPSFDPTCIRDYCYAEYQAAFECIPETCFDHQQPLYDVCFSESFAECQPSTTRECYSGPAGTAGVGACRAGTETCDSTGHWGTCTGARTPSGESCATVEDDDCDGTTNEGCPTCKSNGTACTTASECCSASCNSGVCGTACRSNGTACSASSECCGNYCSGGVCGTAPTCRSSGSTCSYSSQCCSNYCSSTGYCGTAPTCRSNGTSCTYSSECCSSYCSSSGYCGTSSCRSNGSSCSISSECCGGYCTSSGYCSTSSCRSDGYTCTYSSECCSGSCSGGTCGTGGGSCRSNGTSCTYSSQCCSSNCSASGYCSTGSCRASGDPCSSDSSCCSGVCLGTCV